MSHNVLACFIVLFALTVLGIPVSALLFGERNSGVVTFSITVAAILVTAGFGIWTIILSHGQMTAMTRVAGELGQIEAATRQSVNATENLTKGVDSLANVTQEGIDKNIAATAEFAKRTLEAIEKDGAATRQAIVEAHKSIVNLRR
jgi:hypothetical protein